MRKRYFAGDTEMQAVISAAGHFDMLPEEVAFEHVEKRHGFTKRRRRVVIAVDTEAPRREEAASSTVVVDSSAMERTPPVSARPPAAAVITPAAAEAPPVEASTPIIVDEGAETEADIAAAPASEPSAEPVVEAPLSVETPSPAGVESLPEGLASPAPEPGEGQDEAPAAPVPVGDPAVLVCDGLDTLLDLADLDVEPSATVDGADIVVDLDGPEREFLLEDGAEILDALDYLSYRMVRRLGLDPETFRVDSQGYRAGQEEALRVRALEAASKVTTGADEIVFEPLDPAARRVIHLAVRAVDGVTSESDGHGFLKQVRVRPE